MGKLLIIADADKRCSATPRGLELAHRLGYSAEVVAFSWASLKALDLSPQEQAELKQRLLNERESELEKRIGKFQHQGQKVRLKVVWHKDLVEWVLKRIDSGSYEAVVKTGRRTESLIHTPSDWQLLRESKLPVLIVAEEKWQRTKPVLAAVDLTTRNRDKLKLNDKILTQAKQVADALEAKLHVIAAIEVPTLLSDLDMIDPGTYYKNQKTAAEPLVKKLAERHEIPASSFCLKRGPVDKVITSEAAKVRAQLVVMGTVGRKGVKARLLGNTAESVLQLLHTDVLAIKP